MRTESLAAIHKEKSEARVQQVDMTSTESDELEAMPSR